MIGSKLEMHVGILKALANKGSLPLAHLMYEANANLNVLKDLLGFLIKQGLVEEIKVGASEVVYANTERGTSVLRFFGQLDKSLPAKNQQDESYTFSIDS
jgi:predicted transcriptional regulator